MRQDFKQHKIDETGILNNMRSMRQEFQEHEICETGF